MTKKTENTLKGDFNSAQAKAAAYAEKAMIATIGFSDDAPKGTTEAFMQFLEDRRIPHDVLLADGRSITFATTRDPDVDNDTGEMRTKIAGFFTGKYANAFGMQGYYQQNLNPAEKIIPFDKVQRSVAKKFAA